MFSRDFNNKNIVISNVNSKYLTRLILLWTEKTQL